MAAAVAGGRQLLPPHVPQQVGSTFHIGRSNGDGIQTLEDSSSSRAQQQRRERDRDPRMPGSNASTGRVPSIVLGLTGAEASNFSKVSNVSVFSTSPAGSYSQRQQQQRGQQAAAATLPTDGSLRRGIFGPLSTAWARATASSGRKSGTFLADGGSATAANQGGLPLTDDPCASAAATAVAGGKKGRVTLGWNGSGPTRMAAAQGASAPQGAGAAGEGSVSKFKSLTLQMGWQRDSREEEDEQCKSSIQR